MKARRNTETLARDGYGLPRPPRILSCQKTATGYLADVLRMGGR